MNTTSPGAVSVIRKCIDLSYLLMVLILAGSVVAIWSHCLQPNEFYGLILKNQNMFIDFVKLYTGAKILMAGAASQIYDPHVLLDWLNKIEAPASIHQLNYMPYPPYDFALMVPFALLPLIISYGVWCFLTFICGSVGMLIARRGVGYKVAPMELSLAILLTLGSIPSLNNMLLGQSAWLNLGILCVFFAALFNKRDTICGITLAVSTIKPQYLVLMALPVLALRRWKIVCVAAVCEIGLLAVAVGTVGWSNILNYPQILKYDDSNFVHPEVMVSLRGLFSLLMPQSFATPLSGLMFVAGVVLIIKLWLGAKTVYQQIGAASLSTLIYLITSPHVFQYDCLILALPLILTFKQLSLYAAATERGAFRKAWFLLLLLSPVAMWAPYLVQELLASKVMLFFMVSLLVAGAKAGLMSDEPEF